MLLTIALGIVAYITCGALLVYLIARFDESLDDDMMLTFFLWPILLVLITPFAVTELGNKHRNRTK